jgi:hypothetical protein
VRGESRLQESNPALPNTGLAVGHASEMWAELPRKQTKHALGVAQRNAADEMRTQGPYGVSVSPGHGATIAYTPRPIARAGDRG